MLPVIFNLELYLFNLTHTLHEGQMKLDFLKNVQSYKKNLYMTINMALIKNWDFYFKYFLIWWIL